MATSARCPHKNSCIRFQFQHLYLPLILTHFLFSIRIAIMFDRMTKIHFLCFVYILFLLLLNGDKMYALRQHGSWDFACWNFWGHCFHSKYSWIKRWLPILLGMNLRIWPNVWQNIVILTKIHWRSTIKMIFSN